jgi:pimeloyl-ACP methyl ester carboxylesterase
VARLERLVRFGGRQRVRARRCRESVLMLLAVFVSIGCGTALGQSRARRQTDPAVARMGKGFVSRTARVNGTMLYTVRGGKGPAVLLLHVFPQDWYEFHRIMPRLARKFTVVAVDPRGAARSAATIGGYDAANLANDVHQLMGQLKLARVYVVGHDVGGMVAYAFAWLFPRAARGVMILDVPLPGLDPWDEIKGNPRLWHIGFHQTPGLPEKLIAGRQRIYFGEGFFKRHTFNRQAIRQADVSHYATAYAAPAHLRAGLELYRAFPANEKFNAAQRSVVEVPLVLAGGDHSFGKLIPRVAAALRSHGCANVTIETIQNSGHYVVEEQPKSVAGLIERYASRGSRTGRAGPVRGVPACRSVRAHRRSTL